MAKYSRPPSFAGSMDAASMSWGGLAVVIKPPASSSRHIPAHTSHSQQPYHKLVIASYASFHDVELTASHHISKEPIAQYARSSVAEPKLRTPCTIPPLPSRPPISLAIFTKLSTLRWRFPSGMSRRSLPHSQENMQPFGALFGSGGIGFLRSGSR